MPTNKNAMLRYKILDELLSNQYKSYSLDGLTMEVSARLAERSPETNGVSRRQIEKDLNFMEDAFGAMIENYTVSVYDWERDKHVNRLCKRYAKRGYTIFNKELTPDEEYLLSEVISLLGQFDGLPNLDGLERLRYSFDVRPDRRIVSFTKNPIENSNLFGQLFTAISQRQVIEISHRQFGQGKVPQSYLLHPYLLKEYNRRWFLIALSDNDGKIKNFGLERILDIKPRIDCQYIPYDGDIEEMFEDVVGVTVIESNKPEKILFWVSDSSKEYVATKPIHDSQIYYKGAEETEYRLVFPNLTAGGFFSICCKKNYELMRELMSFGENLIVLRPKRIRDEIIGRIRKIDQAYMYSGDHEH